MRFITQINKDYTFSPSRYGERRGRMRFSHIHSHVEQQLALSNVIAHAYYNFTKNGVINLISQGIHARPS